LIGAVLTGVTKILIVSELQVKSLIDRAKLLNQQAKKTKVQQSLEKAQKKFIQTVLRITN
jgi:heme exporter protein D